MKAACVATVLAVSGAIASGVGAAEEDRYLVSINLEAIAASGSHASVLLEAPVPMAMPDGRFLSLLADASEVVPVESIDGATLESTLRGVTQASGRVLSPDLPDGSFVISGDDDGVYGAIWTARGAYEIRGTGERDGAGNHIAEVVSVADTNRGCEAMVPPSYAPLEAPRGGDLDEAIDPDAHRQLRSTEALDPSGDSPGETPQADTADNLRMLMVFMSDTVPFVNNTNAFAVSAINSANTAYANSGVNPVRMQLAGVVTLPTVRASSGREYLYYMTGKEEGLYDEVHGLLDAYGADMCALFVNVSDVCGVAWLSPNNADRGAFSVTDWSCAIGNLTFAHEVGHNFGNSHDAANAGSGYQPYAFGHRWDGNSGIQYRSVMAYAPGSRQMYFSNPSVLFDGVPTGVVGSANNARNMNETALSLTNFRQGTGDTADCDGNGQVDSVELAMGTARDDNRNGIIDQCEINSGAAIDCDGNGQIDAFELSPLYHYNSGPRSFSRATASPSVQFAIPAQPAVESGSVEVEVVGFGDLSASSEYFDLFFDGSAVTQRLYATTYSDCNYNGPKQTFTISAATFNSFAGDGIDVTLLASNAVNGDLCSLEPYVTVKFTYRTAGSADADQNGILDACELVCAADLTTTNTNPGDAGYGEGDLVIDGADLSYYVEAWLGSEPLADLTTTNTNPGDAGYGTADQQVDGADLAYYVEQWLQGCI